MATYKVPGQVEHYKETYTEMLEYISHNLKIDDIKGTLLYERIISHKTYQQIGRKIISDGPIAASEMFVSETLLMDPDPKSFVQFVKVLRNTGQTYLAEKIVEKHDSLRFVDQTEEKRQAIPKFQKEKYQQADKGEQKEGDPEPFSKIEDDRRGPIAQEVGEEHGDNPTDQPLATAASGGRQRPNQVCDDDETLEKDLNILAINKKEPGLDLSNPCDRHIRALPGTTNPSRAFIMDPEKLNNTSKRVIGSGRYATVFASTFEGRPVAIKELHGDILVEQLDEAINKNEELKACRDLSHPSIVKFLGYSFYTFPEDDDHCMFQLVFECIDGCDLRKILGREGKKAKSFELDKYKNHHIAIEIAQAVDYLHGEKVIHGDIKPANIMITQEYKTKVCDLGLSKLVTESSILCTTLVRPGTPLYMAPELYLQTPEARRSCESDIFSFGATMHELFFGNNLWGIDTNASDAEKQLQEKYMEKMTPLSQERDESELHTIIADCVQHEPSCRPKAREVLEQLEKCKPK